MTIREALRKYQSKIPGDETELFLSHLLSWSKAKLYSEYAYKLTLPQSKKLAKLVNERKKGVPVAHLLGQKDFYGLKVIVNKDTLVPRPESEWLVDQVLEFAKTLKKPIRILDLGTGSGAIAVAIAKNLKAQITASDISLKALTIARRNSRAHKANIKFIHSNLLEKIAGSFDIIIANLPYVPLTAYRKLKSGLKYEPKLALTDGSDTAKVYQKLFAEVSALKHQPKLILLEIDPSHPKWLQKYSKKLLPNYSIKFERDLRRLWRYAILQNKNRPST